MRALASFVSSEDGLVYARSHRLWGTDPAADIGDDVLAYNFRVALAMRLSEDSPEEVDPHRAEVERTRKAGERIRALHG